MWILVENRPSDRQVQQEQGATKIPGCRRLPVLLLTVKVEAGAGAVHQVGPEPTGMQALEQPEHQLQHHQAIAE